MTTYLQYNDPLFIIWRAGTIDDPYVDKENTLKIINNRIVLSEIPDEFTHVTISGYTEIFSGSPTSVQFIVNYQNGIIDFNSSENGKSVTAIYKGRGQILYPAERIYAHLEGVTDLPSTLQDIIDSGTGTVSEVTSANSDISIVNNSSTPVITLNSGTGVNQIVKRDGSGDIADVVNVDNKIGDLSGLETTDKSDLVNATNEVNTGLTNLNNTMSSHQANDAPQDDVHGIKTLFQNQQFANLIKNGDFASWSAGIGLNNIPDGWTSYGTGNIQAATGYKGSGTRFWYDNTGGGATVKAGIRSFKFPVKAGEKLTIAWKYKGNKPNYCYLMQSTGSTSIASSVQSISLDTTWYLGYIVAVEVPYDDDLDILIADSIAINDIYDTTIDEVIVVRGELPVAFVNHPNDQHLKAVDYQNSASVNYQYGTLKLQIGKTYIADGLTNITVTYPVAFTTILSVVLTPGSIAEALRVVNMTTTSFGCFRVGTTGANYIYWLALGVE